MNDARRQSFQRKATGFKQFQMSGGLAKKSADASKAAAEKGKLDQLKEEEENNSDDSEGEEEEIMEKTPQKVVSTPQKPIQFNPASP